jgi:hypothetical protein
MEEISSHGFSEYIRRNLLGSGHNFDTEKLNHLQNAFNHALVSSKQTVLKKEHFADALESMQQHDDWKRLMPGQQEAAVAAFKKALKIKDPAKED